MSNLKLLGGEKAVHKNLKDITFEPVAPKAYNTIESMLKKGEISMSPIVGEFEQRFANYIGTKYALCEVNGTTSIQAALFAVGVGAGDEVIVPSYTFWATVGPVVASNAIPVFADVDADTFCLTAETIRKCITPKTKAILLVHVWGMPCDMDSVLKLAKEYNLKVVEDCSHAHGAMYKGKKCGSFGDVGCFSMQGSKVLAAGEAGILVTNSREYYERVLALGHYDKLEKLSEDSAYAKYYLTGLGYKHRVNPLAIAIADAALDKLDEYNEIRNRNGKYFDECISDIDFVKTQKAPEGAERVYAYHYGKLIKEKCEGVSVATILKALNAEGVACGSCGYGRLHKAPLYTELARCSFTCPHYGKEYVLPECLENTEFLAENTFMMAPRFETEDKNVVEQYAEAFRKVADSLDELAEYEKENPVEDINKAKTGRSIIFV